MLTSAELVWLLAASAKGDEAAFERLYESTRAKLYGIVLRILQRTDLADDALQQAYVRIWNAAGQFEPAQSSPLAWMVAIARHRAIDLLRQQSEVAAEHEPAGSEASSAAAQDEPAGSEASPISAQDEPEESEASAAAAQDEPAGSEAPKATAEHEPAGSEASAATAEHEPEGSEASPAAAQDEPGESEASPAAAQDEPGESEASAATAEHEPDGSEASATASSPPPRREMNGELKRLLACLGRLAEDRRRLVLFAYYTGCTRRQLADQFGAPEDEIKTRLRGALAEIREGLGP